MRYENREEFLLNALGDSHTLVTAEFVVGGKLVEYSYIMSIDAFTKDPSFFSEDFGSYVKRRKG